MMQIGQTEASPQTGRESLMSLVTGEYAYKRPRRREVREATVIAVDRDQVIVDLGAKRDGIVPRSDLESLEQAYREGLSTGDTVPVSVLDVSDGQEGIVVSIKGGLAQQDWLRAEKLLESSESCEGQVTDVNRGGVIVPFGRLRGFVPNSHLRSVPRGLRGERLEQAKAALVGRTLTLAVIEVHRGRRRLVLSERVAGRRRRQQLLEELVVGEVCKGVVCSLVPYGAFVDLGGIDGLIHISEMAWKHVRRPDEVVSVGEELEVYILSVDRERERIGLSRKRLLPDPWSLVTENMVEGEVIDGTITNIVGFGAFVDIGEGVEGLVHVSQMPDGEETRTSLTSGTPIKVRVLKVDPWQRRISLSMRHISQMSPLPEHIDQW